MLLTDAVLKELHDKRGKRIDKHTITQYLDDVQ